MDIRAEMAHIGGRLQEDRERVCMTQDVVSELLGQFSPKLAVGRTAISNWEAGRSLPCLVQFRTLCTVYGISGYRTMFGVSQFDLAPGEAVELTSLMKGATPGLQRRVALFMAMMRAAGADR